MSAEVIELTADEIEAAAEAAYIAQELMVRGDGEYAPWANQEWSQPKWRVSIEAAIASVNKGRTEANPLGTVRRHPDGRVAIRVSDTQRGASWTKLCWHYMLDTYPEWGTTTRDDCFAARQIATWPVIYTPESDA